MFFPHPQTLGSHAANIVGALLIGLFFAFIGLNAASGCGQGGQCIGVRDLIISTPQQMAEEGPDQAG